jgi:hypothetical protein
VNDPNTQITSRKMAHQNYAISTQMAVRREDLSRWRFEAKHQGVVER